MGLVDWKAFNFRYNGMVQLGKSRQCDSTGGQQTDNLFFIHVVQQLKFLGQVTLELGWDNGCVAGKAEQKFVLRVDDEAISFQKRGFKQVCTQEGQVRYLQDMLDQLKMDSEIELRRVFHVGN